MARSSNNWSYDSLDSGERTWWNALAEAAESSLYTFAKYFLEFSDMTEKVHGPLADFITRFDMKIPVADLKVDWDGASSPTDDNYTVETGSTYERFTRSRADARNRLVMLARSSFKTSLAAIAYPLWRLIRNPNDGILIASLTEGFSTGTMNAITQHITQNPKLLHYWTGEGNPLTGKHWVKESPKWTTTEAIVAGRGKLGKDLSLKAVGVRAFHPGQHFKLAIVDDPLDREVVDSDEMTATVANFFSDLTPVLDPPAQILCIGTPRVKFDQYQLLRERDNWDVYVRGVYNPDGSLWYPQRFTEKRLAELQEELRNDISEFHSQYLMRPITDSEKALQLDKIHWTSEEGVCDEKELKLKRPDRSKLRVVLSVDPADVSGVGGGSWAGWVLGADADKNVWDLACFKARCDIHKANEEIVKMCKLYKPDVLAIEATSVSRAYIHGTLGRVLQDNNIKVAIHEVTHGGEAKATRIANVKNGLGGCIAMGRLFARETNFALKSELNTFPSLKHMHDLLDAGAYAWRTINELGLYPRKPNASDVRELTPDEARLVRYHESCDAALKRRDQLAARPEFTWDRPGIRRSVKC